MPLRLPVHTNWNLLELIQQGARKALIASPLGLALRLAQNFASEFVLLPAYKRFAIGAKRGDLHQPQTAPIGDGR